MNKFSLGQKVIVNTGGNNTVAIIDHPTIREDMNGKERSYIINVHGNGRAYLCRFTDDITKCYIGGATYVKDSHKTEDRTLFTNAQYINEAFIKASDPS
jgi:hypothetical protein